MLAQKIDQSHSLETSHQSANHTYPMCNWNDLPLEVRMLVIEPVIHDTIKEINQLAIYSGKPIDCSIIQSGSTGYLISPAVVQLRLVSQTFRDLVDWAIRCLPDDLGLLDVVRGGYAQGGFVILGACSFRYASWMTYSAIVTPDSVRFDRNYPLEIPGYHDLFALADISGAQVYHPERNLILVFLSYPRRKVIQLRCTLGSETIIAQFTCGLCLSRPYTLRAGTVRINTANREYAARLFGAFTGWINQCMPVVPMPAFPTLIPEPRSLRSRYLQPSNLAILDQAVIAHEAELLQRV